MDVKKQPTAIYNALTFADLPVSRTQDGILLVIE